MIFFSRKLMGIATLMLVTTFAPLIAMAGAGSPRPGGGQSAEPVPDPAALVRPPSKPDEYRQQPQQAAQPQQPQAQQQGSEPNGTPDGPCAEDLEQSRKGCTTNDMSAGLDEGQRDKARQIMLDDKCKSQAGAADGALKDLGASNAGKSASDCQNATAALTAMKAAACERTSDKCQTTCSNAADYHRKRADYYRTQNQPTLAEESMKKATSMDSKVKTCEKHAKNKDSMMGQMGQLLGAAAQALQMMQQMSQQDQKQDPGASPTPIPSPQDCSNPQVAATSILCICQADPKNRMCQTSPQFPMTSSSTNGDFGPTTPSYGDNESSNDGQALMGGVAKANTASGSGAGGGGGGGGPQAGGGGGGSGAGGGDDGHGRSNVDKNVITGQSGGGGAAGGGFGGGAGGGGGGGSGSRGGGGRGDDGGSFNLGKYLPGSKRRGLSGMSIPSRDGVTGAMGPSIWEKVSKQYQLQKSGLLPE